MKRPPQVWLQAVHLAGWRQVHWPLDKDNLEYHYPRGFDDCFTIEPDLPFKSFL